MNDGFKQRLVGAIVLISVALITWPLIFDESVRDKIDQNSQVPPTPAFKKYSVAEPVRSKNLDPVERPTAEAESAEQASAISDNSPASIKAPAPSQSVQPAEAGLDEPRQDERGLPVGWVLQIASFSRQANAEVMKKALLTQGYKAFTRSIETDEGMSTRVYIGPRLSQDAFEQDRQAINKEFAVKSIVVRYQQ